MCSNIQALTTHLSWTRFGTHEVVVRQGFLLHWRGYLCSSNSSRWRSCLSSGNGHHWGTACLAVAAVHLLHGQAHGLILSVIVVFGVFGIGSGVAWAVRWCFRGDSRYAKVLGADTAAALGSPIDGALVVASWGYLHRLQHFLLAQL